jgi:tRNA U34 5-methylaminomethyl-2-thiouridine-forming methyltransferase MnmC
VQSTNNYELVKLRNGVHSIHSLANDETFHPVIGPVAEAQALYVKQLRLVERLRAHSGEFVIWDVGLGAAANGLTVLNATREISNPVRLVSFDYTLEPLCFALRHCDALGYFGDYQHHVAHLVPHHRVSFTDGARTVEWELHLADFPSLLAECAKRVSRQAPSVATVVGKSMPVGAFHNRPSSSPPAPHAIMFDAYSPATNPEMWTLPLFTNLFRVLDPQRPCAMPTYSRSTMLRVTLLIAGFFVGIGHATGEKEETTLAASTPDLIDEPLDRRWLLRARKSKSAEPLSEPRYRQASLSADTWEKLQAHPQFR